MLYLDWYNTLTPVHVLYFLIQSGPASVPSEEKKKVILVSTHRITLIEQVSATKRPKDADQHETKSQFGLMHLLRDKVCSV